MTFSHMFRRTTPYSSKWVTCLFTSDSGNCLLISIVNISTHIHSVSFPQASCRSLLRAAEVAEDVFTPMRHSSLHQAGAWLVCCKGKCACLFALWHVCPLTDFWGPHCILKTEASRKQPFILYLTCRAHGGKSFWCITHGTVQSCRTDVSFIIRA